MTIRGKLSRGYFTVLGHIRPMTMTDNPGTTLIPPLSPTLATTQFRFQGATNIPRELSTTRLLVSSQSPLTLGGTHRSA